MKTTEPKAEAPQLDAVEALAMAAAAFAGAGADARLFLYRVEPRAPGNSEPGYLRTYSSPPEPDEVREEFGGSTFRIRLRNAGKWTEHNYRFAIEGRPRFVDAAPANGPGEDRLTRLERLVEQLVSGGGRGSTEEEETRAERREFHRTLRQAMITREFGKALNTDTKAADPFAMVDRILEMVDARADDDGMMDGSPLAALVPLVSKILDAPPAPRAAPVRRLPARPAHLNGGGQNPTDRLVSELAKAIDSRMEPADLVKQARANLPPIMLRQLAALSPSAWLTALKGRDPAFEKPGADAYLASVHSALTRPKAKRPPKAKAANA